MNYVNAHATSTPAGDLQEYKALLRVFGQNKGVCSLCLLPPLFPLYLPFRLLFGPFWIPFRSLFRPLLDPVLVPLFILPLFPLFPHLFLFMIPLFPLFSSSFSFYPPIILLLFPYFPPHFFPLIPVTLSFRISPFQSPLWFFHFSFLFLPSHSLFLSDLLLF